MKGLVVTSTWYEHFNYIIVATHEAEANHKNISRSYERAAENHEIQGQISFSLMMTTIILVL